MSDIFKPMLATDADLTKLKFPLLASAKLDGVRATVRGGVVYSRSNKPIPNKFVQEQLGGLEHYDGELIVGPANSKTVYRDTVSHVMSHDKTDYGLGFYVFDHIEKPFNNYLRRFDQLNDKHECVQLHTQKLFNNLDDLLAHEEEVLELGYEGLILRDPAAPYKNGRSTVKEGYLLKLKRFIDAEAMVIGFEERMANNNVATINELGRTKRSSHQENKSGRGDLGALVVRMDGVEFNIGTGFDDAERAAIWNNQTDYLNRLVKFKFFPVGIKQAPRHPVYLGWRDVRDVS